MHHNLSVLLIRTRFTWYYILILSLIGLYSLFSIPFEITTQYFSYSSLYFSGVFGVFSIVSSLMGGISVSKSDQEFLLISAIRKRDLAFALMVAQALGTGILLIAVSIFALVSVNYSGTQYMLAVLNLILLDLFMLTIGIATFKLRRRYRILIAVGIAAWVLSYLAGFQFSPQGFITGNPLFSLLLTSPIASMSVIGALVTFNSEDLPIRVSEARQPKREYRSIARYVNYSPNKAIFMNSFTNLSYSTNSLMAGGIRTTTGKIRIRTYYAIMSLIAVIYGFLAFYLIRFGVQSGGFNEVVLFGSLYAGVLPQFTFNSGTMLYERAWLSFTSVQPWKYISVVVWAKMVQSVLTSIPFIIVSIVDFYLGVANTRESIVVFAILDPMLIGLYLFIVFSFSYYQITEEGFLSTRMSAIQFVSALPLILFTFIVILAILVPMLIWFTAVGTALILLLFATRKSYWERRVNRLVEKGFT